MNSAQTAPTGTAPLDWRAILRNATLTPPNHPRYAEAQQVAKIALDSIGARNEQANLADQPAQPGIPATIAVNFGHGASFGLLGGQVEGPATAQSFPTSRGAPPVAGYGGVGFQTGQPTPDLQYADYRAATQSAHPILSHVADAVGTILSGGLAFNPLTVGMTSAQAGATVAGLTGATRGLIEPIAGFSRAESAALQGGMGVVGGALLGKFAGTVGKVLRLVVRNARGVLGASATPEEIAQATEQAIRSHLAKLKIAPDIVERAVQSWKTTGELSVKGMAPPLVETPIAIRPGETVSAPQPRPAPDPLETPTYQRRGVGGHSYTGTYPAGTTANIPGRAVPSPSGGPQQNMELQQLKILVQMPELQFQEVARNFPPELIQQLRAVRVQAGVPGARP